MGLDSLTFVFLFLPVSILLYYISPNRVKNGVLVGISLAFLALNDRISLALMSGSVIIDYFITFGIVKAKGNLKLRKLFIALCVGKNLGIMLVWGVMTELIKTPLPLGLMVYCTTSLGYVTDVYRGDEPFEPNFINFAVFCTFFGKLYAGPIVQYADISEYIRHKQVSISQLSSGMIGFIGGLAKYVILAGGISKVYALTKAIPKEDTSVISYWILIISFTFVIYFSLSGYCEMAQGLAKIFGMELPTNFNHPFQSRTVWDFFDRFNITVTKFIERYVYFYLGGDTNGTLSTLLNTLLTTMLMGLWFGIRLNYIFWGIYFTCFIMLERYFLLKYLERIPPIFDRIYTFAAVMFSFTIFAGRTLAETGTYVYSMFGLAGLPFSNSQITYIISSNYLIILLCFFFATSLFEQMSKIVRQWKAEVADILSVICYIGLLVVTTAFML